jgi:uncharacterized membrane protein YagU involved in acid resistance
VNLPSILLWGFAATVALTALTILGQSLGLTRIDIPFILGTMFCDDRDRARVVGIAMHMANGWLFAVVYALFFENMHTATWWFGALIGAAQGLFVVVALLPVLPGLHPRMVSDFRGPEPARLLEPPGFLAQNYGRLTAAVVVVTHAIYGAVLGLFYVLSG